MSGPNKLAGISLFEGIPAEALARIDGQVSWKGHKSGDEIFNRNTANRDVFFVAEGRVRIVNYSLSGREVAYAEIPAGAYFGELSAIDGEPRSASIVALDDCVLGALDRETFLGALQEFPIAGLRVMQKLASIVRTADERIMDLATLSAYQRVYRRLLDLTRPDPVTPSAWLIYPLPTQAQIASQASTTRETVARVLGQLSTENIVERKGKTLYVRDKEKLEILAERVAPETASAD